MKQIPVQLVRFINSRGLCNSQKQSLKQSSVCAFLWVLLWNNVFLMKARIVKCMHHASCWAPHLPKILQIYNESLLINTDHNQMCPPLSLPSPSSSPFFALLLSLTRWSQWKIWVQARPSMPSHTDTHTCRQQLCSIHLPPHQHPAKWTPPLSKVASKVSPQPALDGAASKETPSHRSALPRPSRLAFMFRLVWTFKMNQMC